MGWSRKNYSNSNNNFNKISRLKTLIKYYRLGTSTRYSPLSIINAINTLYLNFPTYFRRQTNLISLIYNHKYAFYKATIENALISIKQLEAILKI